MSAQTKPKPSTGKARNDKRRNGKAFKQGHRASRKTPQTELQKALLGGGAMKRIERPAKGNEPEVKAK